MLGEEGLDSAPCIRCRRRLWSGVRQLHHGAEEQRPVRFVVEEGVTGGWINLDIVRYGHRRIADPDLIIPHPELSNRDFWIRELAELEAHER